MFFFSSHFLPTFHNNYMHEHSNKSSIWDFTASKSQRIRVSKRRRESESEREELGQNLNAINLMRGKNEYMHKARRQFVWTVEKITKVWVRKANTNKFLYDDLIVYNAGDNHRQQFASNAMLTNYENYTLKSKIELYFALNIIIKCVCGCVCVCVYVDVRSDKLTPNVNDHEANLKENRASFCSPVDMSEFHAFLAMVWPNLWRVRIRLCYDCEYNISNRSIFLKAHQNVGSNFSCHWKWQISRFHYFRRRSLANE